MYQVDGWSDATGHADLWDGNKCVYQGMHQSLTKFCAGSAHDQGYDFHSFTDVIICKS
ncbi:type VI secretion system amidase effector protein Tae4 [Vibrio parahaemolyticus]|uniref:type VI secretion system amidase effector protein Tae4 n=1 Tax=Vibrio parahaemolyticus TaxID=670 RepID=UPI001E3545CE|nr:type VI secretion system amidase effector protein Tae4 [Vibrio parahaemolyticus]MDF4410355.1 type VI secretion system amidase effector protein Tae4 [Vibrio parahaemolyticus]MDG2642870.1 type VI secretion system amidase effector protein Tae4 [Vibrio parahaemolyticus]MDG3053627.1 type VI secretion system amidase effector protein Tae4 [Vibrio parahaemolyticus]MDS1925848.1 type VI secretion system amidase effector protein Tae4 [Vibrio parahaemolyticus]